MGEPHVAQILGHRSHLSPHRTGLIEWGNERHFKYQDLNERANRLANHLASLGVGQRDRVAILRGMGSNTWTSSLVWPNSGRSLSP